MLQQQHTHIPVRITEQKGLTCNNKASLTSIAVQRSTKSNMKKQFISSSHQPAYYCYLIDFKWGLTFTVPFDSSQFYYISPT